MHAPTINVNFFRGINDSEFYFGLKNIMNPERKRPGYLFAKDFKITNVLGNLQGYKIATGQIGNEEVEDISRQYGGDEGSVFGSLITKAGDVSKQGKRKSDELTTFERTKRRKRRRRQRKKTNKEEDTELEPVTTKNTDVTSVGEPLSIPSSILEYGSSDVDSDQHSNEKCQKLSSVSSSSSDEDGASNFFGLDDEEETLVTTTEVQQSTVEDTVIADNQQHDFDNFQPYPEVHTDLDDWDQTKNKYKEKVSMLSTYKCWKCKRIGHLSEDCTVPVSSSSGAGSTSVPKKHSSIYQDDDDFGTDAATLRDYFNRCHTLRNSKDLKCSTCSGKSNLACCMDCGLILCDGRGHLIDHLRSFTAHNKLYSFKLRRLIKCCKPTCSVVDATKLLMCSTCLSKQFNSHYNMINATWSRSGLRGIPNTIACERHFQWHRINCANTMEEPLLSPEKLENAALQNDGLLSEFFF